MNHTHLLAAVSALCCAPASLPAVAQNRPSLQELYNRLKSEEGKIPLPTPRATHTLAGFDSLGGSSRALPRDRTENLPRVIRKDFRIGVNAVNVSLRFERSDPVGRFSVTAGGRSASAIRNRNSLTIDVGRATRVPYQVTSGTTRYTGTVHIARPLIIGAGVFTIKAMPIAIIYDPPQTHPTLKNIARYSTAESVGTTTSLSFSEESSTTRPETPSQFTDVLAVKGVLEAAAVPAKAIPKVGGIISGALSGIASGLGEASASSTLGNAKVKDSRLSLTFAFGSQAETEGLGSGLGDRIIFLRNARFVWVADGSGVRLALLGSDGEARESVSTLRKALNGELSASVMAALPDRQTIEDLLRLDPLVSGGAGAALPPDRFVFVQSFGGSGTGPSGDQFEFSYSFTSADTQSRTSYLTRTEDLRSGFLSFLGLGVSDTRSTKTTISHTSAAAVSQSKSVGCTGIFHAPPDGRYEVDVYYDRAFGTFAFVQGGAAATPAASGTLRDAEGKPAANQVVTITDGARTFSTRTDAQGRYAFFSSKIRPGKYTLLGRSFRRDIQVTRPSPLTPQRRD